MTGSGVGFSFQNIFYIKCYTFSHYIVSLTLNVLVHFGVAGVGLFKLLLLLTGSEAMKLTLLLYMVLSAYLSRHLFIRVYNFGKWCTLSENSP